MAICWGCGRFLRKRQIQVSKKRILRFAGGLLVLVIITVAFSSRIFNLIVSVIAPLWDKLQLFFGRDYIGATTNRTIIYSSYIERISKNPILGYGTVPVVADYNQYESMRPHNLILEALYQGGIINLVLYLGAIVVSFINIGKKRKENLAIIVSCLFLVLHSLVEPGLFTTNKDFIFWLILGSQIKSYPVL